MVTYEHFIKRLGATEKKKELTFNRGISFGIEAVISSMMVRNYHRMFGHTRTHAKSTYQQRTPKPSLSRQQNITQ
jgi:hypothetical protein